MRTICAGVRVRLVVLFCSRSFFFCCDKQGKTWKNNIENHKKNEFFFFVFSVLHFVYIYVLIYESFKNKILFDVPCCELVFTDKSTSLLHAPEILVLHVKRFRRGYFWSHKVHNR